MILPSTIIKLDYNPTTDILSVEWPDVLDYTKYEAVYALDSIVETVRLYDVKYLLTDTRNGVVEIEDAEYKQILIKFAQSLMTTRLKKLARVVSPSTYREAQISDVKQKTQLSIPIKNFSNVEDALEWLSTSD